MTERTLGDRIWWRLWHHSRELLMRLAGRPLRCSECGREICRAVVFVRHGRVRIIGVEFRNVRVAFSAQETLEFRHVELDQCPAAGREWAGGSPGA